jgi:hypothetical protein
VKLKPCPFCGVDPFSKVEFEVGEQREWTLIYCPNEDCPVSVSVYLPDDESEIAWNKRGKESEN